MLLTTLGYAGFSAYKANSLNAQAAGYTTLYHDPGKGYMIRACKILTPYGYSLRVVYNKPASTPSGSKAHVEVFSGTGSKQLLASRMSQSWWGNQITVLDTAAGSKYNTYKVSIYTTVNRQNYAVITGGFMDYRTTDC